MSQIQSTGEAPAASLVGSLGNFTLSDVLTLLARTNQTGELQVVGSGVDGRVWLDDGELSNAHVGAATTIGQAVFELACVSEGWFYFTAGLVSSSGQPKVPVDAVLDEVSPQVDEWRSLRAVVPLDSDVSLSPTPPADDVQIKGDQWRVLTIIGTGGHSVKAVLDAIGGDQITGLRTIRDLSDAGLVIIADAPEGSGHDGSGPSDAGQTNTTGEVPVTASNGSSSADGSGNLAEVAIMPPPLSSDPWSGPGTDKARSESDGVA